jgi:hypothetical protein
MHVATFIKFGELDHINSLIDRGELYLNTFKYFREIEDGAVRGDRYEGASEIHRGTKGSINTSVGEVVGAYLVSWDLGLFSVVNSNTNIFSIFTLTPNNYPITERVLDFGEYAFVVRRPDEFLARIKTALEAQGVVGCCNRVEYVSDDFTGDIDPFTKRSLFEWQSEWRLKVDGGSGEARKIVIGNLSDIAFICRTTDVNARFTVTREGEQIVPPIHE